MDGKEPHSVSLKVLRLSRPSLALQQPLPASEIVNRRAALANPTSRPDEPFILSPMLTLPVAFGSAYVGETFDCTICVNNEITSAANRKVTSVKISAEMQTPSQMLPLQLSNQHEEASKHGLEYGDSVQSIVHFDLREEGSHTLIVSISYNEALLSNEGNAASGGRIRSFRKLYQFMAGPCLSVRTKASEISIADPALQTKPTCYILEAQLENLADGVISIEKVVFEPREPFSSRSLNWDLQHLELPMMSQREITQVSFLLEEIPLPDAPKRELTRDGRTVLGVLTIHWHSEMGQAGVLSTGWLTTRSR